MADTHPEERLWDMIEEIRVAMLTTRNGERLESRPMSAYVDRAERAIWFITPLDSAKTHEIGEGEPVNLAFVDKSSENYVSLEGYARVLRDPARQKALWNPFAEAWLPQGPEAPDVGLIRVDPTEATLWNSPSSKLVKAWQVARANATQTPPDNEVQHIRL